MRLSASRLCFLLLAAEVDLVNADDLAGLEAFRLRQGPADAPRERFLGGSEDR